jgi:pyruvate formate-lyase/glycerol dehydratase family glycyl radical enzyme
VLPYPTLPVPERITRLRTELFATANNVCHERALIVTDSYRQTEGEHWVLRRAKALYAVLTQMPLLIREGELLVGQRAAHLGARSLYPEYHLWGLTPDSCPPVVWDYWHGHTLGDEVQRAMPERMLRARKELAAGFVTSESTGFGHVIVDYPKALHEGFNAIIAQARGLLAETPSDDIEGQAFLQAVVIAGEGLILFAQRHASLVERLAGECADPTRAAELRRLAAICQRVPAEPAHDFHEALQSLWLVQIALHLEQYGWSISPGHFDQYMLPYYRADLASGRLTQAQAWELLLSLWVKFMENVGSDLRTTIFQNICLGGQDAQGNDLANELSSLCLDATIALRFNQPALTVRWHPKIAPAFWDKVQRTIAQGTGMPSLFNDEVIIPGLVAQGVTPADAVTYGIIGCVEIGIPGKEQGVTAGGHINAAKALELALNEGRSLLTGDLIGWPTPDPATFGGFDDLWQAYKNQIEYLGSLNVLATIVAGEAQKRRGHCPLMSALLDDCLANRRDLVYGGTRYNLPGVCIYGTTNVCDGMLAIQRLVCEERALSWGELRHALRTDYRDREPLRQMLAHGAPRFGNDLPEVDELANRINALHTAFCSKHVDARNGRFAVGVWPVEAHVDCGRWTGATPDGRHQGTPLVDGVGACQGADRHGPTALLRSVARLHTARDFPAGSTFNIKFGATTVQSPAGVTNLGNLTTTFMRLGGQQLQVNVVDAATLRAAQKQPEAYNDLIVRVAGFSAYFVQLDRSVQEEIISRTEHGV